jgi:hypothetical protein
VQKQRRGGGEEIRLRKRSASCTTLSAMASGMSNVSRSSAMGNEARHAQKTTRKGARQAEGLDKFRRGLVGGH